MEEQTTVKRVLKDIGMTIFIPLSIGLSVVSIVRNIREYIKYMDSKQEVKEQKE